MNWIVLASLLLIFAGIAFAEAPSPVEQTSASGLAKAMFRHTPASEIVPPFSFVVGGRPFSEVRGSWELKRSTRKLDGTRTRTTLTWRDPVSRLTVRCVAIEYSDFPVVEWTVYLRNDGDADTPIIEDVQALDRSFERAKRGEFLLHHNKGSATRRDDYQPLDTPLPPGSKQRYCAVGGRPNSQDLSFFNLDWGGQGVIVAVGWPGQWAAMFERDSAIGCRVIAGQELTHFRLHPGEEFRTPLIALQSWAGDWIHSQNVWRRWMIAHNLPKVNGAAPKPMLLATSSRIYTEMIHASEANQEMFIDRYADERIKLDYWWMDAGWYVNKGEWGDVGTWEVDRKRFPNGLRAISDHANAKGIKTLVWFEPERVAPNSWLDRNHPEWILDSPTADKNWGRLLNLGNPTAYKWLLAHTDGLIRSEGIGLYRQDFNIDPLTFWRGADAPDRQGIGENRYVVAHLKFWDELRKRHPDMLIDTCASGGRRVDLESLRRAVPLWRSDYAYEPIGHQCQTYGISMWIPFHGTGTTASAAAAYYSEGNPPLDPYTFWSNVGPSTVLTLDLRPIDTDYGAIRAMVEDWRATADDRLGDYYPLTSFTDADDKWVAWQFNSPDNGTGMVQAFRRTGSLDETANYRLRGLDPGAGYEVSYLERSGEPRIESGRDLMGTGVTVAIPGRPGYAVLVYRKAGAR